MRRIRSKWLPVLASSVVFSLPAYAQDAGSANDSSGGYNANEIVVTALKRSESIQDVPAAITALSGETLTERGLNGAEALASQVPGLQFTEHATSTLFAIRGIVLDIVTGAGEPSVASHIDGVYQPRPTSPLIDFSDVDRVEVLRGPQGTLYGRNATGGTINFVSAAPTNSLAGAVTAGIGSFDGRLLRGFVSGPIAGDAVKARLAAAYDENDGFTKNLLTGGRLEGRERIYLHGALTLEPIDNLTIDLGAYYIDEDKNGPVQVLFEQGPFFELVAPDTPTLFTTEPHEVYNDFIPRTTRKLKLFTGRVSLDLTDKIALKSITGYSDFDYEQVFDGDGTSLNYIAVGAPSTGPGHSLSDAFSQEFNVTGTVGALDFVVGAFYFREDYDQLTVFEFPIGIPGLAPGGSNFYAAANETTKSTAVFADVTLHVTDQLRLIAGARQTWDSKDYVQTFGFSLPGFPIGTGPGMACVDTLYKGKWNSFTPKFGAQFDAGPDVMLYGQFQKGNKAGQFNLTVCGNEVNPESVASYEVGIKAQLIDRRLTLNMSAFHYDYKDLQVNRFSQVGGVPTSILDNAATAKINGFELEMVANPSRRFAVNIAVAYLNSKYEDYLIDPENGINLKDNQLTRAPEWSLKSGAEYRLPLAGFLSELTLRGELNFTDRLFFDASNDRNLSQPSVIVINGYATLASDDSGLEFRVFGKNLTDEVIIANRFPAATQNAVQGFYAAPRTWGAEVTKRF